MKYSIIISIVIMFSCRAFGQSTFIYKGEVLKVISKSDGYFNYDTVRFNKTHDTAFLIKYAKKTKVEPFYFKDFGSPSTMLIKFYMDNKLVFQFKSNDVFSINSESVDFGHYNGKKEFKYNKTTVQLVQ